MTVRASEHRQLLQLSQIRGLSLASSAAVIFVDDDDDDGLRRQVVGRGEGWLVVEVVVVVGAGGIVGAGGAGEAGGTAVQVGEQDLELEQFRQQQQ